MSAEQPTRQEENARDGLARVCLLIPAYQPSPDLPDLVAGLLAQPFVAVLVVNDGSDARCRPVFDALAQRPRVTVLEHTVNQGKGAALKTGFRRVLEALPDALGVVTMDADGQHGMQDVLRVAEMLARNPDTLVLGGRRFQGQVPWRSRFGNTVTRWIFRLLTGVSVYDTQTGLRGIPTHMLKGMLSIAADRFDYEMEMLVWAARSRNAIREVPIETLYLADNASSHFRPLLDSVSVYRAMARAALRARHEG